MKKSIDVEEQNEYAEDIKGNEIHILNAKSGAQGYYCFGCKTEMQAIRSKIPKRKHFFRHIALDITKEKTRKCTFSNKEYRHKLAIDILKIRKSIKVPTLYKYPPKGIEGKLNLLNESRYIEAHSVKSEVSIYETESGEIRIGSNPEIKNKNLPIIPDLLFFDENEKPILLIEIVVSHGINHEKRTKIRRLGIDTIQVVIPKDSRENIEQNFDITKNTKWVYNAKEQNTDYIFIPKRNGEGISSIDELQRRLFEESFKCRSSQINNLIRAINKNLGTKQYKSIKESFGRELSKVETNTEECFKQYDNFEKQLQEDISSKHRKREEELKTERIRITKKERKLEEWNLDQRRELRHKFEELENEINREEENLKNSNRGLEERYFKKKGELEKEQSDISTTIQESRNFSNTEEGIRAEKENIEIRIGNVKRDKAENLRYRNELQSKHGQLDIKLQSEFNGYKYDLEEEIRTVSKIFREEKSKLEEEIRLQEKEFIEQLRKQIEKSNFIGESQYEQRIKKLLRARGILHDISKSEIKYKLYKQARKHIEEGTYKNWL